MPFGKNSHLTVLRHFPRWHQLACTSLTESAQVFAQFCCSYLLSGCLINALYSLPQPSALISIVFFSHPPRTRSHASRAVAASPLAPLKYGANWEKRRTPGKDFHEYLLVLSPLKSFVQVLNKQVFALMQKTDCLSRKASLTFSVSSLAKFCLF